MVDFVFVSFLEVRMYCVSRKELDHGQNECEVPTYRLRIAFRDTLRDYLWIALTMARISTILTLIPARLQQEVTAICAHHYLVELPLDKLVSIHLMDFAMSHADCALSPKFSGIDGTTADVLFD